MSPTERYNRFVDYVIQTNSLVRVNSGIAPGLQNQLEELPTARWFRVGSI